MAITFVGSYVGTHAATSAQTVNFSNLRDESNAQPTLQQNDYVLVAVENASTVDRTQAQLTPSGYTALHTDNYQNDSNDSNFLVSAKFMGATPDTSVAIPASNATTAGVAYAIYVFRGVDTTTPMDVAPVVVGGINTGIANPGDIIPVTNQNWIVAFGGAAVAAGAVFTNPAGMSTTTNHFRSATITTTTNDANIGGAILVNWAALLYDPGAFGGSTSTNTGSWSAVTIALRPAAGPADQNLTASLFAPTPTFYAPTVGRGPVDLAPSLYSAAPTFYAHTVASVGADQNLTAALFSPSPSFYSPTVAATYALTAALYAPSPTFHAPTVAAGPVDLAAALFTASPTFYTHTISGSGGQQDLTAALFSASPTFYGHTLATSNTLTPSLFAGTPSFYTATVTAPRVISVTATSISYSGQSIAVIRGRSITVAAGGFSYSGQSVSLIRARTIAIIAGTIQYSGQFVDVVVGTGAAIGKVFRRLGLFLGLNK
jgi:hypothetical protein